MCLYALSIGPAKDALLSPLENAFRLETGPSGDVIVILGGGTEAEALSRLMCGHRLWKRLHIPLIVTGSGERTDVTPVEHPLYHLPELQGGLKGPGSTG